MNMVWQPNDTPLAAPIDVDPNAELVWMLGQPHLEDFLRFVKTKVVGGGEMCPRWLTDQWRAANDRYYDLEKTEAGAADGAETEPVPDMLAPLEAEVFADRYFRRSYDSLPTTIKMIDLEKLIVSQDHVANIFSDERGRALGSQPDPAALFRFCLPLESAMPPVTIRRIASDRYLLSSFSTDLRAHSPRLLTQDKLPDVDSFGPVAAMLGVGIGFGSNFMSAIRSEGRIVLHNGHHRAYSLYALGIRKAPCLIETVTRTDELNLTAGGDLADRPAFFFRAARPPLLRDFFNPELTMRLPMRKLETMVEVQVKVRSWVATDLSDAE